MPSRLSLNNRFQTLLVLPENQFAWSALQQITLSPDGEGQLLDCGLLYLYGPSGTGKTELIHHFFPETTPHIDRLTAREFAAELAEAAEQKQMEVFQHVFRELDVLIIEDLQGIEDRPETQQQLIAIIDHLLSQGGKVILSGRMSPGEFTGMHPRLINRCHGGICARIDLPGVESRRQLLTRMAQEADLPLTPEGIELLVQALPFSPRELRASIQRLKTVAQWQQKSLSAAFVEEFLQSEVAPVAPTLSQITRYVARHFGLSVAELRSQTRKQEITLPRQCAMTLARELTGESLEKIGGYFSGRNHSTVLHSCERVQQLCETHPSLQQELQEIRRTIRENFG